MLGVKSRNIGTVHHQVTKNGAWDHRPCGMLVQKRNIDHVHQTQILVPITIKVKVRCGSSYHEVYIKPQETFGNYHFSYIYFLKLTVGSNISYPSLMWVFLISYKCIDRV